MKTFDDFIARQQSDPWLYMCRDRQQNGRPAHFKRYWRKRTQHLKERKTLSALAAANRRHEFVGTVMERGCRGRWRTVRLENERLKGA